MIFLIDTCFWSHIKDLYDSNIIDLYPIINQFKWGLTEEIKKEIMHFRLDQYIHLNDAYSIPVSKTELENYQKIYFPIKNFDIADQTLIIAGKRDNLTVLTDDGALYMECLAQKIDSFLLPNFSIILVKYGDLEKNSMFKMLRFWEKTKRYSKLQLKRWKSLLQSI